MNYFPQPSDFQLPSNPMPLLVQLGLTYRCNLKCQHCYALYRRDLNEFTTEETLSLIDDLWDLGSSSIVYSHGENLIRKDFHQIARAIYEKGMYQTLMANGFYIRSIEDAEKLKETGINRVLVSIDSPDHEIHDENRGVKGAFETALESIKLLKEVNVPTIGFSTTIDVHNYDEVDSIVELGIENGIDAISFMQNRYNRPGIFNRKLWLKYVAVCQKLYELTLANENIIDIYTHDPFMLTILDDRLTDQAKRENFIGSNICNVGTSMISIDPVGNVTGCNFIETSVGNVRKEPVANIWDRLVNKYSDINDPPKGPCESCSQTPACMGGCKAFHYNGKYDERCGETRFGEKTSHGKGVRELPLYPTASLSQEAGKFIRKTEGGN